MATTSLTRREGEAIVWLLAVSRLSWGLLQVLAPGLVGRSLGRPGALPRSLLRMKGGRDLAMGLGGVVVGSEQGMTRWVEAGLYVDVVDTLATLLDGGRALRPRTLVLGSLAGAAAVVAALVALDVVDDG